MNGAFEIRCGINKARIATYSMMRVISPRVYSGSPVIDNRVVS